METFETHYESRELKNQRDLLLFNAEYTDWVDQWDEVSLDITVYYPSGKSRYYISTTQEYFEFFLCRASLLNLNMTMNVEIYMKSIL